MNIVNTTWRAKWDNNMVDFFIAPNGVVLATHPLIKAVTGMDRVEGRWRIDYDTAHVEITLGGRTYHHKILISGAHMYLNNEKLERVN